MCIIAYKPKGEKKIPKRILQKCWQNNWDGAGYAIWDDKKDTWRVRKGLMTFTKFWQTYREEKIDTNDTVIVHFRIGTSGGGGEQMCHPFPVTDKLSEMVELEYEAENLVFHNGVHGFGDKDYSDTCYAIKEIIDPLHAHIEDDKVFHYLIEPLQADDNSWFITKGARMYQYGEWIESEGIEYSNDTFKKDRQPAQTSKPHHDIGIPIGEVCDYRKPNGNFDWEKWEARGSNQSELPWNKGADVAPNENEEYDDDAVIVSIDANGNGHPEGTYNNEKAQELLCCPNCYHDKYLDNSPFSVGDTICLICGSVFLDLTGEIITFDHDLHNKWKNKLGEADNG